MSSNLYVDLRSTMVSVDSMDEPDSLEYDTRGWYWGQMTKAEVNEQLQDQPDGSFLVRDGSEPGYFTLTVKKRGVNKLVKIYCRNGMYGFSEPYGFQSLDELIYHFRTHSLSTHNSNLDIKLLYPVEKAKRDSVGDDAKKKRDYRELIEDLRIKEHNLETLFDKMADLQEQLQIKEKLADSLEETLSIYEQQVDLHRQFHGQVSSLDIQSVRDNFHALQARVDEICDKREEIAQEIGGITRENRTIISTIAELKQDIRRAARQKTKRKRLLVDLNLLPHAVEDTWNIGVCDRQEAISLLQDRESGTFLVRKSEKNGKTSHVLSLVENNIVVHIKILEKPIYENGEMVYCEYGIAEGFCVHPTLIDLVLHYEETSLSEHNSAIRQTLRYPVFKAQIDDYYESEPIYG